MSANRIKLLSYVTGFVLSVILTLVAYMLVSRQLVRGWEAVILLSVLAVIQLAVQLVFFLHLSRRGEGRHKLLLFGFSVVVVVILVGGTLWVMNNLHGHYDNVQSPERIEQQIIQDEGIERPRK